MRDKMADMNDTSNQNQDNGSMSSVDKSYLALIELDDQEKIICTIKKHPIGLLLIYLSGVFIALIVLVITSVAGVLLMDQGPVELRSTPIGLALIVLGALIALIVLFFTYVSGFIYQHNIILVTSDKIAQIVYKNLINRKVSQLSIGEIQDISVDQSGFLSRIFNYGTLVIETAGEQNNYNFTYAPFPYNCSKQIVGAHELSIKKYGN